jgi:hypothetical protein
MARKRNTESVGPQGQRNQAACAHHGEHGQCGKPAAFSANNLGGGPWYCGEHMFGEKPARASTATITAQVRCAYWRAHEGLQRHIGEQAFAACGYDAALLQQLGVRAGLTATLRQWPREPGEEAYEDAITETTA